MREPCGCTGGWGGSNCAWHTLTCTFWALVAVAAVAFLIAGCVPAAPPEPKVTDGTGKLPAWVTEVWRDNVNGITCWSNCTLCTFNNSVATCFRDRVECPAPVAP